MQYMQPGHVNEDTTSEGATNLTARPGSRWTSFTLVLAIVMMLMAAVMSSVLSLIAYSRTYDNSDQNNNQAAQLKILQSVAEQNREHINRLYRENELLRDQVRELYSRNSGSRR